MVLAFVFSWRIQVVGRCRGWGATISDILDGVNALNRSNKKDDYVRKSCASTVHHCVRADMRFFFCTVAAMLVSFRRYVHFKQEARAEQRRDGVLRVNNVWKRSR